MDHTRLYYTDSYTTQFEAPVEAIFDLNGKPAVRLAQTYFYPSSGGQLHDTGSIGGVPVLDVVEHDGRVAHLLAQPLPGISQGAIVPCAIDRDRRLGMMHHHSGQHILSQAFTHTAGATTVSIHLTAEGACTIDLDTNTLNDAAMADAEALANSIIQSSVPVRSYIITDAQLPQIPLRKPPKVQGEIRIVQIGDFDWSACGGTHVAQTGELGLIKIRRYERRGSGTRLEFLCGTRALADYSSKNNTVNELAGLLSSKERDLPAAVRRLQDESKQKSREIAALHEQLAAYEARALLANAEQLASGVRLVRHIFTDRGIEAARLFAQQLTAQPGTVALLAVRPVMPPAKGPQVQICFACSAGLPYNMGALVKNACRTLGGSGGGSPTLAQGGGSDPAQLEAALAAAEDELRAQP